MKAAAKLKGLNYKQVAIDHGEKVGFAIVVLLALFALWSSRWSTYKRAPEEMFVEVEKAEQDLAQSQWPDAEQQTYSTRYNVGDKLGAMLSPLDPMPYQYPLASNELFWPLVPPAQPIREPQWVPVEDLIATAGNFIMAEATAPLGSPLAAAEGEGTETETAETAEDEIARQFQIRGAGAGPGAMGVAGMPGPMGYPGGGEMASGSGYGMPGAGYGSYGGDAGEMYSSGYGGGEGYGGYGGMMMGAVQEGRGVRFVSVRGVYPLREQMEKLIKAMNLPSNTKADQVIEIKDLEVQRQAAGPGENPWSDKDEDWETLDYKFAIDVLQEAADFDEDVVLAEATDPVITMPLPMRIVGWWDDFASHPRLKDFHLTETGRQLQRELNAKILEEMAKQEKLRSQTQAGGFAAIQRNMRSLRGSFYSEYGSGAAGSQMYTSMSQDLGNIDPKQLEKIIQNSVKAAGYYLLFRYLDFDVEPGKAYRYRVRLVLKNPAYGRPVEEAYRPEVVQGETRTTDWSEPTGPVIVPDDSAYFIARTRTSGATGLPEARFDVFQWLPEIGTTTLVQGFRTYVGNYIAGTEKTEVVDPAQQKFEQQEVAVTTSDMLVDVLSPPAALSDLHADLGLSRGALDVPDQALIVDEYGQLATIDPISRSRERDQYAKVADIWKEQFAHLKERAQMPQGEGYGEGAEAYMQYYGKMMGEAAGEKGKKKKGRRRSPIRMPYGGY